METEPVVRHWHCSCSTEPPVPARRSKILLGVTGSVAAIKIPEIVERLSALSEAIEEIRIVPTETSLKFFNPSAVVTSDSESVQSRARVPVKVFRDADEWSTWNGRGDPVLHIDLAKWANIIVLAPLDANTLAKISNGICDNLLTCVIRAWDLKANKPLIFCPAMNTKMWEHPLTSEQVNRLIEFGYHYVPPVEKTLICGDTGIGAMALVDTIIYVSMLLKSGSAEVIKLAKEFIEKSPPEEAKRKPKPTRQHSSEYSSSFSLFIFIIPYYRGLDMVIDSAQMYFDSSSSYADPDMELCKACLSLIQNPKEPRVAFMFDLVDAVKLINKDFRLSILPHAVRICQDKLDLVRQAVEKSKGGYKKIQQLLKLVVFLHIDGLTMEEAESIVLEIAGDTAMDERDLKLGVQICQKIMAKQYKAGWNIFTHLAQIQSDPPIIDPDTTASFINYALSICPDSKIPTVLIAKYLIEIRSLQTRLMELSPGDDPTVVKATLQVRISEKNFLQNL